MNEVFGTFSESVRFDRDTDTMENQKVFTLTCIVPQRASSSASLPVTSSWLNIGGEGDFLIERVQGSAQGPVNSKGQRIIDGSASTTFPMPGTSTLGGVSQKGLQMKIFDVASGLNLATELFHFTSKEPWIDVNSYLSPGYAQDGFLAPMQHFYFLPVNSVLRFDFQNLDFPVDAVDSVYHRIDIALIGKRYV